MKNLLYTALLCMLCSCSNPKTANSRIITDMLGRETAIPDSVKKIVCVGPSALRLYSYAGNINMLSGIEDIELRNPGYIHLLAYPHISGLPVIGPMMGGDAELLTANAPDVIITASLSAAEASLIQKQTGVPVVALRHGNLGAERGDFYTALRLIGTICSTTSRADSLISYIETSIAQLGGRSSSRNIKPSVYIGGMSYKGTRNITATDPFYAAFLLNNTYNAATGIDRRVISPTTGTFIDPEALIQWDPDYLFFDSNGLGLIRNDFRNPVMRSLCAFRNGETHRLYPYNNYHSNFELMLANAWYVNSVLSPTHIDIEEKAREILTAFTGIDVYSLIDPSWGACGKIAIE